MKYWLRLAGILALVLSLAVMTSGLAEGSFSGAAEATTGDTSSESSIAGAGGSMAGAAEASAGGSGSGSGSSGSSGGTGGSGSGGTGGASSESSFTSTGAGGAGGGAGAGSASGAASAGAGSVSSESSFTSTGAGGAGGAGSSASSASAETTHTHSETSSTMTGTGAGGAVSSSSSSSTTTTTTTTSTSTSTFAGWPVPGKPTKKHSHGGSGSYAPIESIIQSTDVTGRGWTTISKVNVRTMPSTRAGLVFQVRAAGTEMAVTTRVINSSGETWYGVKLYQGYVGYIRGDLLRADVTEVTAAAATVRDATEQSIITMVEQKTHVTPQVIYIIVDPQEEETPSTPDPQVYIITPEQARELGIG